jgi:hypothetical protein
MKIRTGIKTGVSLQEVTDQVENFSKKVTEILNKPREFISSYINS